MTDSFKTFSKTAKLIYFLNYYLIMCIVLLFTQCMRDLCKEEDYTFLNSLGKQEESLEESTCLESECQEKQEERVNLFTTFHLVNLQKSVFINAYSLSLHISAIFSVLLDPVSTGARAAGTRKAT